MLTRKGSRWALAGRLDYTHPMNRRRVWLCALAFALCGASRASAQDQGAVGLTMGYPLDVGAIWHVAERFALRPEVSLSKSSFEQSIESFGGSAKSTGSSVGLGISGLFYVGKWDALRAYVAPRFVYSRTTGSLVRRTELRVFDPTLPVTFPLVPSSTTTTVTTIETTMSTKSAIGLFGASYSLHKHFSIFGETGVSYSTTSLTAKGTPDLAAAGSSIFPASHGWAIRTGVGVIVYF
jgi:hypothetical protein